jgi:hypothetical protein
MNLRLWYPQLDVYDAIRRMSILLGRWRPGAPSIERLYIVDFFFANPWLLYKTALPQLVRTEFQKLAVSRPEHVFVSLPSAPLLFRKMEEVQRQAVRSLTGKGLVDREGVSAGLARLSDKGSTLAADVIRRLSDSTEEPLIHFLVTHFAEIDRSDIESLRRRTGLHRLCQ